MKRAAPRFVDIAVNLTDCVFRGIDWKGKTIHENDFPLVIQRAKDNGVKAIVVSGTTLEQSERAVALCREHPGFLYCTVGVHPANCAEFLKPLDGGAEVEGESEAKFAEVRIARLLDLIEANRDVVLAVGEVGLDYAELHMTPKEVQQQFFDAQFVLAEKTKLPMFLHSRECGMDFVAAVEKHRSMFSTGVVHSFNGSAEELDALLRIGLSIGLNASAFRTREVAELCLQRIPLDRLMLETDAPWCDVRKKDWGFPFVKTEFPTRRKDGFISGQCVDRRNEPCHMRHVLEECVGAAAELGIPALSGLDEVALSEAIFKNSMELFRLPAAVAADE